MEYEKKEREWVERELRAQYEATTLTEKEMNNLQEFVKKLHNLLEDKGKTIEGQKVQFKRTLGTIFRYSTQYNSK